MLNKKSLDTILSNAGEGDNYKVLSAIQVAINDLNNEQVNIKEDISDIKKHRVYDSLQLKNLCKTVDDIRSSDKLKISIKKNIKDSLFRGLGIISVLLTCLTVVIGYMSYEAGLYKPIPTAKHNTK